MIIYNQNYKSEGILLSIHPAKFSQDRHFGIVLEKI